MANSFRARKIIGFTFLVLLGYVMITSVDVVLQTRGYHIVAAPVSAQGTSSSESNSTQEQPILQNDESRAVVTSPPAAYDASKPKFLHVLSYQRSGSSIVGDLLQNMSKVWYVYEPLDGVYASMYGTVSGWNVPGDIFLTKQGEIRKPPPEEMNMTKFVMESIYTCKFSELPYQLLMHRFMDYFKRFMPEVGKYAKCCQKRDKKLFGRLDECSKSIRPFCKTRFADNVDNQRTCSQLLYNDGRWFSELEEIKTTLRTNHPRLTNATVSKTAADFARYFKCLANYSEIVKPCAREFLDAPCARYPIRAVKTVRAFADVDEYLMEKYDNFRYIHLVRDPRGTAKSRYLQTWARGLYEGRDPGKIAGAYCRIAEYNERVRGRLAARHPGKTLSLVFDDITANPRENVEAVFGFIREAVTNSTRTWVNQLEKGRVKGGVKGPRARKEEKSRMGAARGGNTTDIVRETQWKVFFKYNEVEDMHRMCFDFFKLIKFDWDGFVSLDD